MKSYYDFVFFSSVYPSLERFKSIIQILEDLKNSWKIVRPKKNNGSFAKQIKIAKNLPTQKIGFDQILNPKR